MSLDQEENWKPFIRVLLYPAQFDKFPKACVTRVLQQTVETDDWGNSIDSFLNSIDAALTSTEDLSALIPQPHSDPVVREYLVAIKEELLRRRALGT